MSRHDPKVTLRQITDYALRAQELCAQNELPAILTDWLRPQFVTSKSAPRRVLGMR